MRQLKQALVGVGIFLCALPASASPFLRDFQVIPLEASSVMPIRARYYVIFSSCCSFRFVARRALEGSDLFLDLVARQIGFLPSFTEGTVIADFGTLPAGVYRVHGRLVAPSGFVYEEEIQELLVRPGQVEFQLLRQVHQAAPLAGLDAVEISGMAVDRKRLLAADRGNHVVLELDDSSFEIVGIDTDLGGFIPDALARRSLALATHHNREGQFLLRLGSGVVQEARPLSIFAGALLEALELFELDYYYFFLFAGRASPPELFVLSVSGEPAPQLVGAGVPIASLDIDRWRILASDPTGPRVVVIDSVDVTGPRIVEADGSDVSWDVEVEPSFGVEPVDLEPLGVALDERSYPAELVPSAAALAWLDGRIVMAGPDGKTLEFQPLRVEMTADGNVLPVWPPFLEAVDILAGDLGTAALFDGGVFLGSARCLEDNLPNGQVAPAADPPAGAGYFYLARPAFQGAEYGPAGQGLRRVVPPEADCSPTQ